MTYVLFVCTHNDGRSQMAQALFEPCIANGFASCRCACRRPWRFARP
jgi:protein-tyrosine-phosphatase